MRKAIAYLMFLIAIAAVAGIVVLLVQSRQRQTPVQVSFMGAEPTDATKAAAPPQTPVAIKSETPPDSVVEDDATVSEKPATPVSEEVLAVKKTLQAAWETVQSASIKTAAEGTINLQAPDGAEQVILTHGQGAIECLRSDGTLLFRAEGEASTDPQGSGPLPRMTNKILAVSDGTVLNMQTEMRGQVTVVQQPPNLEYLPYPLGPEQIVETLATHTSGDNVKVLPEETIDGKTACVLESKPANPGEKPIYTNQTLRFYIAKDTGIPVKVEYYNPDGSLANRMTYTVVSVNEPVAPDRFAYTPPEGAKVQDLRKAATRSPEPAASPAPARSAGPETN